MSAEKINHHGSYSTQTIFKAIDGTHIGITVWFTTERTSANLRTYYNFSVSTKPKRCRNWKFEFVSENSKDIRVFQYINEDQLYTAFFNHWNKLNPVRMFANGSVNGELLNFSVKEKTQPFKHFQY